MLLKYTKQGNFHNLKRKTRIILDRCKLFGEFAEDNRKGKAGPQERLRTSMSNILISEVGLRGSLSAKIL